MTHAAHSHWICLVGFVATMFAGITARAEEPGVRVKAFYGYQDAIELSRGDARAILCPQVGGRVLEFSVAGHHALWLDDKEKSWQPGQPGPASAGRFDYGPELTVPAHPTLWTGEWTGRTTGPFAARLTSPEDERAGIQLVRDFQLAGSGPAAEAAPFHLVCTQTIRNIGKSPQDVCHWGRSFSPGGGICVIPLGDHPSRFPSRYAMYEDSAIINVRNQDDQIRIRDGFLEILAPPRKPKLGFDATGGWLAYLMRDNTLFVKRFAVHPDRVYAEAAALTLSVWYPQGPRIELEPIGPRERLKPGESAAFTEDWWLLTFPFPAPGQNIDLGALRKVVEATIH